ncbi:MAG: hypothetical protein EZS28_031547, partial [Streblomastix strix]
MTLFEPLTANIIIAIEELEQFHIDWKETQTETEFVTLKINNELEITTQEPWIIRRKEDRFIPKFSKNKCGYLRGNVGGQIAKHLKMFIFEQMAQSEAHVMDVIQIHDETLFGNSRYNKVGLVEQVRNINQQITILQSAPESYDQEQLDEMLLLKADKSELIDSYSKTEDDALLLLKANVADLTNYVDLTSDQTITGQKQFGVISVSSISKQSKNDASILLAGGGDMLVSSLVTQPQLYEVRDIATGKSKAYVFSTQGELSDWIAIQNNVAKLVIGDNLYIVDKEVTDYWWDETDLKVLETELPDMSNVITTLGAATGSGNAITDVSIDGITLTPAKNTSLVTTGFDQSITWMKIFTSTIISNDIQYSGNDNSSVFLAGGGVRSIADIQSASYSKSEDDALLLLKADKTELIDSYTKTETNNLLNSKTDTGVSYTKGEDDVLLLLKADKPQLIDLYIKGETDNLLNNKANQSTIYSKSETYTRDEVYIKTVTDQLISQIETGNVDLSSYYTKTKTDELLDEKAKTTDLSNYMTLSTSQTITANKTFNNACRFVSSIDGMSTVTGSSFVKYGADDT